MNMLYSLSHLGYAIPPQADCGWIGEAGPGPSYGDDGTGFDNEFTQRNTTIMSWTLLHMARMLNTSLRCRKAAPSPCADVRAGVGLERAGKITFLR